MTGKRHLRFLGISDKTLAIYKREVSLFMTYLEFHQLRMPRSYDRLDRTVANYSNRLYQEGEALTRAGWLLSGLRRLYPRIRKELAISQQWYNNWCRHHTPTRGIPLTWPITPGFVSLAMHQHWYNLALLYLVGFVFFLRTQELFQLEPRDFRVDVREGSIVLRIKASKTSQGAQQSLAMTDVKLAALVHYLLTKLSDSQPLWTFSVSHFRNVLKAFAKFFDLSHMGFVPHSLRRGGATHLYLRSNNLELVMIQGRWKDAATARLYLDDSRATLVRVALPESSRRLLRHFRVPLSSFLDRFAKDKL